MFLADTHSDTLFSLGVGKRTFAQTDITPDRLRQGGVSLQTLALWSGPESLLSVLNYRAILLFLVLSVAIRKLPKVHPIVFIGVGALAGIIFQF